MKLIYLTISASLLLSAMATSDWYTLPEADSNLGAAAQLVDACVKEHYPAAKTHAFEELIHFEYATELVVTDAIVKAPLGQPVAKALCRAPTKGGVWCDIQINDGGKDLPISARAEGPVKRGSFFEYSFRIYPKAEPEHHLAVTLRLPVKSERKGKAFVKELKSSLEKFTFDP